MQKSYRFLISTLFLGAYLLSACTGAMPQQDDSLDSPGSSQSAEAVFTGTVESMGGGQWLISGQLVDVDGATSVDPNIQVGDVVKVEASVSADGAVVALKIESSGPDNANANDNTANSNDDNANDDSTNTNDNTNSSNVNSNDDNSNDDNSNTAPAGPEQEAFGVVEAVTDGSITIGGITYSIANFTEFKDLIAVGDQVKIHVIVNADGTLTIREIEKYTGTGIGDDGNSNDDNSNLNGNNNDDDNSNSTSNDDDDDDNSNSNSNDDDDHDDDNSNDSNSNDD